MVRKELGIPHPAQAKGLAGELDVCSARMKQALLAANEAYAKLGVRYALVGGLAAGAHGEPRATKDIDFLIGDEAFVHAGPIIAFACPMPLQAYDVPIDPIPLPEHPGRKALLDDAVSHPVIDSTLGVDIPMVSPTYLAFMKLASPRAKDLGDVVALINAGNVDVPALMTATENDSELRQRLNVALVEVDSD
jgi:hypothetical protein